MVEDVIRGLPPLPTPKFPSIDAAEIRITYDRDGDILLVKLGPPRPAMSVDVGGEFWLRMDPVSGEVHGIEIEGVQIGYLKRHPEQADAWRQVGVDGAHDLTDEVRATLVQLILRVVKSAVPKRGWLSPASRQGSRVTP